METIEKEDEIILINVEHLLWRVSISFSLNITIPSEHCRYEKSFHLDGYEIFFCLLFIQVA